MAAETINLQRFVPKFVLSLFSKWGLYNNTYLLGQRGPIWISVTEPYNLYNEISELRSIIDMNASMFSNMKLYKRDKKSKKLLEDPYLDKLLNNPNCTQSQNQFLKQYRAQLLVYGNAFVLKRTGTVKGVMPSALWPISPYYLQPVLTGKLFDQVTMEGIIEKYRMINTLAITIDGIGATAYNYPGFATEDILFSRIPDLNNPLIGKSPIASLQYPISNIKTAYRARNIGHQHVGVGLLSPKVTKDGFGQMALDPSARKNVEEQFGNDYGIGYDQRRTILSNASMDFSSMAVETKNMMLIEEVNADVAAICNVYNMSPQLFLSNTTYENFRASIVQVYQDNIIPAADEFVQALGPFLGLKDNEELCASYEHLSILKENKLKGMQAIQAIVASLSQAIASGIIDPKVASTILANELNLSSSSY